MQCNPLSQMATNREAHLYNLNTDIQDIRTHASCSFSRLFYHHPDVNCTTYHRPPIYCISEKNQNRISRCVFIIYYCQTRVVSHVSVSTKMSSTSKHHRLHKLDSVRPVHYRKDTPVGTKCQAFAHHLMNKTK